jgi:hypothetical protein
VEFLWKFEAGRAVNAVGGSGSGREQALEVKLAQARLGRRPFEAELFSQVPDHPVRDMPELEAGQ